MIFANFFGKSSQKTDAYYQVLAYNVTQDFVKDALNNQDLRFAKTFEKPDHVTKIDETRFEIKSYYITQDGKKYPFVARVKMNDEEHWSLISLN